VDVPGVAGLDGAWLEPTKRSAAARRLVFPAAQDRGDVWTPPFRLMAALGFQGEMTACGAALELPLAAWTLAAGPDGRTSAAWTVDLQAAGLDRIADPAVLASALSDDGSRLLVGRGVGRGSALFATRGGRL
jgi:hypothetical protein